MKRYLKTLYPPLGALLLSLALGSLASCPQPQDTGISSYAVRYDKNGGEGTVPSAQAYPSGEAVSVTAASGDGLSRQGYHFSGWNTAQDGSGASYAPGATFQVEGDLTLYASWSPWSTKTFSAQSVVPSGFYTLTGVKLAEGTHCVVYGEDVFYKIATPAVAQQIVNEYETKIYPRLTPVFGEPLDVNKDGKVLLLLLDIRDGYDGGGYVAGYFDSSHMMEGSGSNLADMLFLDIDPGKPDSDVFYATIAHELQHLIDFGKQTSRDLWINEGLSLSAEYLYFGSQREDRIELYKNAAEPGYELTIPQGNNFFVWNGDWEREYRDALSNYATAYLFFQWLRLQAKGTALGGEDGSGIYKAISNSSLGDYRAVIGAAAQIIDPAFADWPTLLGSWMLANWYNDGSGFFGYRGEITGLPRFVITDPKKEYLLAPGEGVFSGLSGGAASYSPGGNIKYQGLADAVPDVLGGLFTASSQTGKNLLTFNGNSSTGGGKETGSLGSVSLEAGGASPRAARAGSFRGPYPISIEEARAGRGR